jgi:hypothetical protein
VGETLDWTQSLDVLGRDGVDARSADRTLGALLKTREDLERVREGGIQPLIDRAAARGGPRDDQAA